MINNDVVCQKCGHVTKDADTDVPAIRCEDCHSFEVLWRVKRKIAIRLPSGEDRLKFGAGLYG